MNLRYRFCRRRHPELVRVKGKVFWSGTHRFGVDLVYGQAALRDARFSPRFKWTPADRLTSITAQEAARQRAVEPVDVVGTVWRRKAGYDKWGIWRVKGEAYQLVRYKVERRYKSWVAIQDDESVETLTA